jgi:phosphoglycolate phosphatase-like HAD superfamily hydrolase
MLKAIALDFDGVICDGFTECLLVTWYGWHDGRLGDFGAAGVSAVPPTFVEKFAHCRAFAKNLAQFYVAFLTGVELVQTQVEFERLFATAPTEAVEQFVRKVTAYRASVRGALRSYWLDQHTLYPGIATYLRQLNVPAFIVTAKDADSVAEILQHAGVPFAYDRIYGDLRDKQAAWADVMSRVGTTSRRDVAVVDDNVLNALSAHQAGFRALWALWGYRTGDHARIAREHAVPAIDLDLFVKGHAWENAA